MQFFTKIFLTFLIVSLMSGCTDIIPRDRLVKITLINNNQETLHNVTFILYGEEEYIGDIHSQESKDITIDLKNHIGETSIELTYELDNKENQYTLLGYTVGSIFGSMTITIDESGEIIHKGMR